MPYETHVRQFKENDQKDRKSLKTKTTGPLRLKHQKPQLGKKLALMGWSIPSIEALEKLGRPFIVVSLPEFQDYAKLHKIPFLAWDFGDLPSYDDVYDRTKELYHKLQTLDVDHAIPIFEETVEWAGALNAHFRNDSNVYDHSILFRDKATMKRRAHLGGLHVGVFEEAENKKDVRRFFNRMNQVLLRRQGDDPDPIHVKALNKAGAAGHRMILSEADIDDKLNDDNFPSLIESHLEGTEISCEAFIYKGKVKFLNITEYVVFGYSMMAPPSPHIEKYRSQVRQEVQKLVDVFDIECGVIHPEFFISEDDTLYFGEVANRVPGGHIFDLIQKTYQFNPFVAYILCCDPNTTEAELEAFFPDEKSAKGHAGSFLVYPRSTHIQAVEIPKELEEHPCFDKHTLSRPGTSKIEQSGEGYGNHLGTLFFHGDDSHQVREQLEAYIDFDFFV